MICDNKSASRINASAVCVSSTTSARARKRVSGARKIVGEPGDCQRTIPLELLVLADRVITATHRVGGSLGRLSHGPADLPDDGQRAE